jgi:hypothetical protein
VRLPPRLTFGKFVSSEFGEGHQLVSGNLRY